MIKCPKCGGDVEVVDGKIEDHPTSRGQEFDPNVGLLFGTTDQCAAGGEFFNTSPAASATPKS